MKAYTLAELLAFSVQQYEKMHTRHLLNVFRQARMCYASLVHYGEHNAEPDAIELGKRIPEMKKVLDAREHVPSKRESREKRKERIKKGK